MATATGEERDMAAIGGMWIKAAEWTEEETGIGLGVGGWTEEGKGIGLGVRGWTEEETGMLLDLMSTSGSDQRRRG